MLLLFIFCWLRRLRPASTNAALTFGHFHARHLRYDFSSSNSSVENSVWFFLWFLLLTVKYLLQKEASPSLAIRFWLKSVPFNSRRLKEFFALFFLCFKEIFVLKNYCRK
ncbi:hypothetical protein IEQ34_012836 [Dendrobium chrysotoxum]|uniref:Secreted protein n=1 Tax=Dendrobium chrysotoxum TaxID=161865 RepID=A0AAV7GMZ6_DENCH|nr:hypothetical protein IEQ34_012836 [Dendrobium chrysotoxum]